MPIFSPAYSGELFWSCSQHNHNLSSVLPVVVRRSRSCLSSCAVFVHARDRVLSLVLLVIASAHQCCCSSKPILRSAYQQITFLVLRVIYAIINLLLLVPDSERTPSRGVRCEQLLCSETKCATQDQESDEPMWQYRAKPLLTMPAVTSPPTRPDMGDEAACLVVQPLGENSARHDNIRAHAARTPAITLLP
jgi:hypothetical protein